LLDPFKFAYYADRSGLKPASAIWSSGSLRRRPQRHLLIAGS